MPRRTSIPRKSKYSVESNRVTDRFRAKLMRDGKRTLSDRILRQALARAEFQAIAACRSASAGSSRRRASAVARA
jgi:ribosomal protein S7